MNEEKITLIADNRLQNSIKSNSLVRIEDYSLLIYQSCYSIYIILLSVGRITSSEEKVVLELRVKRSILFLCRVTFLSTLTYVIARVFSKRGFHLGLQPFWNPLLSKFVLKSVRYTPFPQQSM